LTKTARSAVPCGNRSCSPQPAVAAARRRVRPRAKPSDRAARLRENREHVARVGARAHRRAAVKERGTNRQVGPSWSATEGWLPSPSCLEPVVARRAYFRSARAKVGAERAAGRTSACRPQRARASLDPRCCYCLNATAGRGSVVPHAPLSRLIRCSSLGGAERTPGIESGALGSPSWPTCRSEQ
jgi:hypothetical protein